MVIPVKRLDVGELTQELRAKQVAKLIANTAENADGCWEWQGFRNRMGYGSAGFRGKVWMAHRLMWVLLKGPLPPKLYVCHRCDNPSCINVEHMFLGDHLANQQDKHRKGRCPQRAKKTCPKGHPYDGDNLYVDSRGFRHCRICARVRQRVKAGWTEEQALSLEVTPHGYRPVNGKFHRTSTETEGATS